MVDHKARGDFTEPSPLPAPTPSQGGFPIVGIGASAGGLQALCDLFDAMPDDAGVALVVVQHLDPTRKSLTTEVLAKHTRMHVCEVEDAPSAATPNRVYVIPPGRYLSIAGGDLHLSEPDRPRGARMAIDFFLRSLAEDQKQCAVGIILSGSGTDGTLGIKAIKAAGGLVIAQDVATAEHDSMPLSAIATGVVDHVLPPRRMPDVLVNYARHPYVYEGQAGARVDEGEGEDEQAEPGATSGLSSVISLLRAHTKHDFRPYKEKTLVRRTHRRMCLHHIEDYDTYLDFLRTHPPEVDALVKDLLITVTDFFREPEAWEELRRLAIRPLVERKEPDEPIRVWTPGCATGEEPYSMAMLILEELAQSGKSCPLNLFASDIDKDAIAFARAGRYPKSIAADVSPERLRRFFTEKPGDDYYHVNKLLRESVVFALQDLIADPPFSRLDLICCRNLLIYLKPDVQERVVALCHFALRAEGLLFLGSAETIGRQIDLFKTLHKRWRIFQRLGPTRSDRLGMPIVDWRRHRDVEATATPPERREVRLAQLAQQRLLELLSPPAVLVDERWKIVYVAGNVDPYLKHRSGEPTDNLLDKARHGLRSRLRMAVQKASSEQRSVSVTARVERDDGSSHPVVVTVQILGGQQPGEGLILVVFDDEAADRMRVHERDRKKAAIEARTPRADGTGPPADELDENSVIRQLEEELGATRDDLRATIEQLEVSNEEYKATHEESMSINEELQSANEELETSKEELQSLNEELSTVNSQLAAKVDELETKHADLENLLAATDMPTLCLDTTLAVRWFTAAAQQLIRLKNTDRGRPVADLTHDFAVDDLVEISQGVLARLTTIQDEVSCHDGRTYMRRVSPYRTDDHRIGGVVITFVDITKRKNSEIELRQAKELSDRIVDTMRETALVLDAKLVVLRASRMFYERFQISPDDTLGRKVYELGNGDWNIPRLRTLLEHVLPDNHVLNDFMVDHVFKSIGRRVLVLNARQISPDQQILAIEDVTELLSAQEALEDQVKQRTEMLRILQDITRAANEAQTTDEALRAALDRIGCYTGCQVGHVWRVARDGSGEFVSAGTWYFTEHPEDAIARFDEYRRIAETFRVKPGQGVIGSVVESREARWVDEIDRDPKWLRGDPALLGLRSTIAFPVVVNEQVVAVLEFFSDQPIRREEDFMEVMPDVGIQLGHVMERKRLEREADNAAAEQQRHIGRELHDSIAQELTGIGMMAEMLRTRLAESESPFAVQAGKLVTHLRTAQRQVSQLSRGLVPAEVDAENLVSALEDLIAQCNELRSDAVCEFRCTDAVVLDDSSTATNLYRIAQEAIQNACKHAAPTAILLELGVDDGDLVLSIQNDGVRPQPPRSTRGRGLRIMRYRASLIGGRLEIDPEPDRFKVTCRVNLRSQQG